MHLRHRRARAQARSHAALVTSLVAAICALAVMAAPAAAASGALALPGSAPTLGGAPGARTTTGSARTATGLFLQRRAHAAAIGECKKQVAFALIEATTTGCLTEVANDRWESTDTVNLNGLPLPVIPGTRLVLSGPTTANPGGSLAVATTISLSGITIYSGQLSVALPAGIRGEEGDLKSFMPAKNQKLFGLEVGGSAAMRLGFAANGNHYVLFRVVLQLPSIFKNGPNQDAGGLTGTVGVKVDAAGVHADAVKIEVANAYVGQIGIKSLCLSYTAANTTTTTPCAPPAFGGKQLLDCAGGTDVSRWDGAAVIVLPTQSRTEVGVFAGIRGGSFSYAGAQVEKLGNLVPLATGVYLDRVGIAICVNPPPFRIKGAAAIRFGPEFNGTQAALLDGSIEYVDSRPWVIDARGNLALFGRPFASGFLTYRSNGVLDFGFRAGFDFTVASLDAEVKGWIETRIPVRFTVDGRGSVCVAKVACLTGEVTVSNVGVGGCFTISNFTYYVLVKDHDWKWYAPWRSHWESRTVRLAAGLGYKWGARGPDVLGNSCDLGPYRAARSAVVSAAGDRTVIFGREPGVGVRLKGVTAPPEVVLVGPDGRRISTPAALGRIDQGDSVIAKDPETRVTEVLVAHPTPGRWTIHPKPGSSKIAGVELSQTEEPPTVIADVGGHGRHRVLGYTYSTEGQEITFVERTPGRDEPKTIGRAAGKPCPTEGDGPADRGRPLCGRIRFTQSDGYAGVRDIWAISSNDGVAFEERLVATYQASPPRRPAKPRGVTLARRRNSVVVNWDRPAHGIGLQHNIDVFLSDGRRLLLEHDPGSDRGIIRSVPRGVRVRVAVYALDEDERMSRPAGARLRARQVHSAPARRRA
jgi:hypothetical protein